MKISKTAIFLFELMVVILVFSLAAAVCASIFGKAYGVSEQSKALTMAVLKAESVAEEFKAGKTPDGDLLFDREWRATTDRDRAVYRVTADVSGDGGVRVMDVAVTKVEGGGANSDPEDVYALKVKSYVE
jgi:hypothetical protein